MSALKTISASAVSTVFGFFLYFFDTITEKVGLSSESRLKRLIPFVIVQFIVLTTLDFSSIDMSTLASSVFGYNQTF